jgi:PIN domain nuclease of toxin-antitoxin system
MSKIKERGKFYGAIKTVKVRKNGRIIHKIPFDRLVNEVANDASFSVVTRRKNSSTHTTRRDPRIK